MKKQFNRRSFVKSGTMAGCLLLAGGKLAATSLFQPDPQRMNPKLVNYCGYTCPTDCKFLQASVKNDPVMKKEAYDIWEMDTRFGVKEFDPDKIFCFGCKNTDKPVGIRLQKCDVRNCAISKKLDCCIECPELKTCVKDLWKKFPDYKKQLDQYQDKWLEGKA